MLGWKAVDVRDLGELSEAERDEIELEENSRRKDLTPYERSKMLVRLAETAKTVLTEQAEFRPETGRNSPGRPPQPASERAVAERIGVPRQTIQKAQQHVAAAEKYPELQAPTVTQQAATETVMPGSSRGSNHTAITSWLSGNTASSQERPRR